MKIQSLLTLVVSLFFVVVHAEEFSLITNETSYPVDVFEFRKLKQFCFAGAEPIIGHQIYLQYDKKPRVLSFPKDVNPIMLSILPHESHQVPAHERIVLRCSKPFYFKQCVHCRNLFGFGLGNEMFAYQLIETKPGWHYLVYDDNTPKLNQQKAAK